MTRSKTEPCPHGIPTTVSCQECVLRDTLEAHAYAVRKWEEFEEKFLVHLIFNAYWDALDFELPTTKSPWKRWIDTSLESPNDICPWNEAPTVDGHRHRAGARSVAVLFTDSERTSS